MSVHDTSGQSPISISGSPESDSTAASADADGGIQPDPLLKSGAFIDATVEAPPESPNRRWKSQQPDIPSNGIPDSGKSNFSGMASPVTEHASASTDASTPLRKRASEQSQDVVAALDTPGWLPAGWTIVDKVRNSGATAGTRDKYYVDPVSGFRFRSKVEVLYFLETGSRRGKKPKGDSSAENVSQETPGTKKKGSVSRKKVPPRASKFDFASVPDRVRWVLTDATAETWTPFVNDEKQPESTKKEWAAAFESASFR